MNARRVLAIARKESLHIVRDPRSLGMGIAIPILLLLLFGYALKLDVDNVQLVVWDQSQTTASREFVSHFDGSPYFEVHHHVDNDRDLTRAIDTGEVLGALVIPYDFDGRQVTGPATPVQLILDGSDSNTATIAMSYAEVITQLYSQERMQRQMERGGGPRLETPLEVRSRVWFNADMESRNYIIPGLIAVIMMVIAAMLTSLCFAREWERGTMEQLIATPVQGRELILGKLLPYFVIGLVDMLLAVLMGQFLFHVPLRGNVALLFGTASIFLVGVLAMGMIISIVTKQQLLASQLAMTITFLPSFLLSGFIFSIPNMPAVIQGITYLVPSRYYIAILRGIYLKGVGLEILAMDVVLLVVFGALIVLLANAKFKKRLD